MLENPCLSIAIDRLTAARPDHYAIWILQPPYPSGYGHFDRIWPENLAQTWQTWHSLYSLRGLPEIPRIPAEYVAAPPPLTAEANLTHPPASFSGRIMQQMGVSLWKWLFDGPIQSSFDQSRGIAIGQGRPLRLRLDIRDPDLIALPWEIMQPEAGMQAVSLSQQLLFSRTSSAVEPLPELRSEQSLNILLVLGQDQDGRSNARLQLDQEAAALSNILQQSVESIPYPSIARRRCDVKTLLQPTPAELAAHLETERYNVFFYSGHGEVGADGGLLFLRADATMNGTELAQVLSRCRVKLAVFNSCWGAQPDESLNQVMQRSSLAEVLLHHGVPAVLAMRDSIEDREALSFIQVFARTLAEGASIDRAVAIARQHLLTEYKFNWPAWTLPVLYMHPQFDGELIKLPDEGRTVIPWPQDREMPAPTAALRSLVSPSRIWRISNGIMRIGRRDDNDLVLREDGVSRDHATIVYRTSAENGAQPAYFLRDSSSFGTYIASASGWHLVHHREVPLRSNTQLKFGSEHNPPLEFVIDEALVN